MGVVIDDDGFVPKERSQGTTPHHYPTEEIKPSWFQKTRTASFALVKNAGYYSLVLLIAVAVIIFLLVAVVVVYSIGVGFGSMAQAWLGLPVSLILLAGASKIIIEDPGNTFVDKISLRVGSIIFLMIGSGVFMGAVASSTFLTERTERILSIFVR